MKRNLIDFPSIYENQPNPTGQPWLEKYQVATTKAEAGGIIVFLGNRGTGKSRMAFEISKNANLPNSMVQCGVNHQEPRPAIYRTAMEIFMELRSTYSKTSDETEYDLFGWYRDASLLVIDELQERGETAFEDQKLTAIVDSRYRKGRATILIGNYSPADFAKSVSASILSRIQESGAVVDFKWNSYRASK